MQEFCKNSTYITPALLFTNFYLAFFHSCRKFMLNFVITMKYDILVYTKALARKLKNNIFFVFALKSKLYKAICGHICIKEIENFFLGSRQLCKPKRKSGAVMQTLEKVGSLHNFQKLSQ